MEKIPVKDLGIIVVDMQEHFLCDLAPKVKDKLLKTQNQVLTHLYDKVPLYVLEFKKSGWTDEHLMDIIDCWGNKEYVQKKCRDGFIGTKLEDNLREQDVNTVLITGIFASLCVELTARGAYERGFQVMSSRDLISNWKYAPSHDCPSSGYLMHETEEWFKENGIYRQKHDSLLKLISL